MVRPEFATDLSREQFEQVRNLLESARRRTRPRKHDLYDVFCAVLYLLETGAPWRSVPVEFPPWRTVHEYFSQWTISSGNQPTLLETALLAVQRPLAVERLRLLLALR